MNRLFLDANVLFSAAYRQQSRLFDLWALPDTQLLTSAYAEMEARRNLSRQEQVARLDELLATVELVEYALSPLPSDIGLPEKDWPILQAAIAGDATHLITGDHRHFGALFGRTISGVYVCTVADYLSHR